MNMAEHLSLPKYSEWAKKLILQLDRAEKRNTDFSRIDRLPRIFLKDYLDKTTE
jgi:hypothetical protein